MREPEYRSPTRFELSSSDDPYLRPAFSKRDRLGRFIWTACWVVFFRPSLRPMHGWRSALLRLFGAKMGPDCHVYPRARIWAPWNLQCEDQVTIADGAEIYNPGQISFGSHAIVSQNAYVCGASHDYNDSTFPLVAFRMRISAYAWICARASVGPGVDVGEGAVLGLGSVATHDLEPWGVYAGCPAVKVKERTRVQAHEALIASEENHGIS